MKKRVLIADDAMFMRATLKKIIESNDRYEVIGEAEDGAEAFSMYKKLKPDVVTMDITMPDMDGIEGLQKIREFDPNANVIMISAVGKEENVVKAITSGAKNFIIKPFKADLVIKVLDSCF